MMKTISNVDIHTPKEYTGGDDDASGDSQGATRAWFVSEGVCRSVWGESFGHTPLGTGVADTHGSGSLASSGDCLRTKGGHARAGTRDEIWARKAVG